MRIKFIVKVRAIKQAWEIDSLNGFKIIVQCLSGMNGLSKYQVHKEQ